MIALDYNPTEQKVAEKGFMLAKSMKAEVILLHVITDPSHYPKTGYYPLLNIHSKRMMDSTSFDNSDVMREEALKFLNKTKEYHGDESIQILVKEGDSAETILETSKELNVDIIVMGSHSSRWLEDILIGSVTEKVLRHTSIPLYIIPIRKNM